MIEIFLPASKSISNRILIINALSGNLNPVHNLSGAKDTQDLIRCLRSEEKNLHVGEGATTLRFLLAYFAVTQQHKILQCGSSLKRRPVKTLLVTLEKLGCKFRFLEEEYELPLEIIEGVNENYQDELIIDTSVSSQFVSAVLLIAPYLKNGLEIKYSEWLVSEPYIQMTKKLMKHYGADLIEKDHATKVMPSNYIDAEFTVESDWSAAAFYYALFGLTDVKSIYFPNLRISGLQGDEIIIEFFKQFGIYSIQEEGGVRIYKSIIEPPNRVEFDFTDYPDLFPPLAMFCALKKTNAHFSGLQHLVFKESNRLRIISDFLINQKVKIIYDQFDREKLNADFMMSTFNKKVPYLYLSHNDHRIAMAFSLLKTIRKIYIDRAEVVEKSFPGYWDELKKII
jgi:3-phosphoshikimate 1-carboxyvinyltransferase